MRLPQRSNNPYCAFKDDRERRHALIARDIRLVVIALAAAISTPTVRNVFVWLVS